MTKLYQTYVHQIKNVQGFHIPNPCILIETSVSEANNGYEYIYIYTHTHIHTHIVSLVLPVHLI